MREEAVAMAGFARAMLVLLAVMVLWISLSEASVTNPNDSKCAEGLISYSPYSDLFY